MSNNKIRYSTKDTALLYTVGDQRLSEKHRKETVRQIPANTIKQIREITLSFVTNKIDHAPKHLVKKARESKEWIKKFVDYNENLHPDQHRKLLQTSLGLQYCADILPALLHLIEPTAAPPPEEEEEEVIDAIIEEDEKENE